MMTVTVIILLIVSRATCTEVQVEEPTPDGPEESPFDENLRGCECWSWPECSGNCTVNPLLKHTVRSEHRLLSTLALPFVLMFPYQDRKMRSKYGTSTAGKRGTYFGSTKFWIHMPNQHHVQIRIQKSRIFAGPDTYSTLYYQTNSKGQTYPFASNKMDHCFYTGTVREEQDLVNTESYVAVDTCYGLRGLIHVGNTSFGVYPLHCTACQPELLPHVVFPLVAAPVEREDPKLPVFWQPTDVLSQKSPRLRKPSDHIYTIRLSLLMDHQLYTAFDQKLEQCIHYTGSVVNQATKSFLGLPIELRLVQSEIWNLNDHIQRNLSIKATLNDLAAYAVKQGRTKRDRVWATTPPQANWLRRRYRQVSGGSNTAQSTESDLTALTVLLTPTPFTDSVEYLAVPDSICTPRALAVIQVNISETAYHTSRLLTLAIADVLGIRSFPCPPRYSCSVEKLLSEGDKARIRLALVSGMSDCLVPDPSEAARYHTDTCGNGRVDRGEECDPGQVLSPNSNNTVPCCNPNTCLADIGAVCTHGACCSQCRLAPRGHLCRPAHDLCDLPEFCNGTEPTCPADLYLENGSPCRTQVPQLRQPRAHFPTVQSPPVEQSMIDEANALCYQGRCPTRDSQCQSIWGTGSSNAADYCFVLHNTRTAGACAVQGENCAVEHAMCGLLHCQGGEPRPVSEEAQAGQPFLTYTEHKGKQFECKHLSHTSAVRFVPEGAACAEDRFCFHQQCVPPHVAFRSRCPLGVSPSNGPRTHGRNSTQTPSAKAPCSNQGVCTNGGFCLCFPGWTGAACNQPQTMITSVTAQRSLSYPTPTLAPGVAQHVLLPDLETVALIWAYMDKLRRMEGIENLATKDQLHSFYLALILGSVVGGTFLLLALFLLIYRRRERSRLSRKTSRSQCFSLPKRILPGPTAANAKPGFTSIPMDSTFLESSDLKYTALPPNRDSLPSTKHGPERSYFSRWSHSRHHSGGRSSRRRHNDTSDAPRERRQRHHHRHCHRRNDGTGRSRGRSAKYSDGTPEPEERHLAEENYSDTELAYRTQDWLREDSTSIDRIIKFGSMPSYKEDKRKRDKRSSDRSPPGSLSARSATSAVQTSVIGSTNGWVTSTAPVFITDMSLHESMIGAPAGDGLTHDVSSALSPILFTRTTSPRLTAEVPLSTAASWSIEPNGKLVGLSADASRSTAAVTLSSTAVAAVTSSTKDHLSSAPSEASLDAPVEVPTDNTWRHPERGILKNKHEGGTSAQSKHNSPGRSHKHHSRRRKRHRHHCHHPRCRRPSRDPDVSLCSCCQHDGEGAHQISLDQEKRIRSASGVDRRRSSTSSSSGSTHSSTGSFDGAGNPDLTSSSSSSSTTSTCSTALEVGPDGNVRRAPGQDLKMVELDRTRNKTGYEQAVQRSLRDSNKDDDDDTTTRSGRRRHHHHSHGKRCCHSPSRSTLGSSTNVTVTESTGSSSVGTSVTGGTPSISGASSSSSSAGRHFHRRRRRRHLRSRRSTDDDEVASCCSHRSSPPVPTILCNAGQQTDEVGILRDGAAPSSGQGMANVRNGMPSTKHTTDDSEFEWEEIECNESACEECQAQRVPRTQANPYPQQHQQPNDSATVPISLTTAHTHNPGGGSGHTNPAYMQSARLDGDVLLSSPSSICQQQSTASSSLSSARNSRMSTPAFNNTPAFPVANAPVTTYSSPTASLAMVKGAVAGGGSSGGGVANRAASSSSCSSTSAAAPAGMPLARPPVMPGKVLNSDDHTAQHSETEVDAHLQLHNAAPRPQRAFYGPHRQTPSCTSYSVVSPAYPPLQQTLPTTPIGLGTRMIPRSHMPVHPSTHNRTRAGFGYPENGGDSYYQHPYEDVATDEYAETTGGRLAHAHIYHQHGLPQDLNPNAIANGRTFLGHDEDDEQLSLDEGQSTHPSALQPADAMFGRYDDALTPSIYPRAIDGRIPNAWKPDGSSTEFREAYQLHRPSGTLSSGSYYHPKQVNSNDHPDHCRKPSQFAHGDDTSSDVSLSAFRRDDRQTSYTPQSSAAPQPGALFRPGVRHSHTTAPDDCWPSGTRSNDGTCDTGSDTSSLPEAGCDLVQLAQLDMTGSRPNPILNDLARQHRKPQTHMTFLPHDSG